MTDIRDNSNLSSKAKDTVRYKRTFSEQAVSAVPGFWSHSEKEILRRSDQIVRDVIGKELNEANDTLRECYRSALEIYGRSAECNRLERILINNDTLIQKIVHAQRGYSPLMNAVKVDELTLARLTDYDAVLEKDAESLINEVKSLEESLSSKDLFKNNLTNIETIVKTIKNNFDLRDEFLKMGV